VSFKQKVSSRNKNAGQNTGFHDSKSKFFLVYDPIALSCFQNGSAHEETTVQRVYFSDGLLVKPFPQKIIKVANSNSAHRESPLGPDERRGETSIRTLLAAQPHMGRSKHKGGETPTVERPKARMGAYLLGKAMFLSVGCGGH